MLKENEIIDKILIKGLETLKEKDLDKRHFHKIKNNIYKKYYIKTPFSSIQILHRYNKLISSGKLEENLVLKKILRKRGVRSLSGVTVISLLTKSFPCPGKCIYCPTFKGLPKSYVPNEPAVMRAELNKFDPVMQIHNRLRALEITGHKIEKNDVRIIGGTRSVYEEDYKENFIKGIYDAFNSYDEMKKNIEKTNLSSDKFASFKIKTGYKMKKSKNLEEAKKINEKSRCRVIGMAIETRPDRIDIEEISKLRRFGVTRVEIGYQTTYDEINKLNKRGHGNKESIKATRLLKNAGMKVVAHMMPNLLGSTAEKDIESMKEIFNNPNFRPDELKIYPMVVTDNSELTSVWRKGGFKSYDDETLINLMADLEYIVPEYVRINRSYRDIPASEILHGSIISNLRQVAENKLKSEGKKLMDIRSRELKDKNNDPQKAVLKVLKYEASEGYEYFLTFEDPKDRTIFSLLRLRLLPSTKQKFFNTKNVDISIKKKLKNFKAEFLDEIVGYSLIREVHTFGDQLGIGEAGSTFGQHIGFGKKLIKQAEKLSKENGFSKIMVISGVGSREYYKKIGYELKEEYMMKNL